MTTTQREERTHFSCIVTACFPDSCTFKGLNDQCEATPTQAYSGRSLRHAEGAGGVQGRMKDDYDLRKLQDGHSCGLLKYSFNTVTVYTRMHFTHSTLNRSNTSHCP